MTEIEIPDGLGDISTHIGWRIITDKSSAQYKLKEYYGMHFNNNGFGYIDDEEERYLAIACTTTFGDVGDKLEVELKSGNTFFAVICDIKNQNDKDCNKYGHNNGHCVFKFFVDIDSREWAGYGGKKFPKRAWPLKNNRVTKITNIGDFYFE